MATTATRSSPTPRLRRADCTGPGLRRRRQGRGFVYLDPDGERVKEPEVLTRIHELVIPPAWDEVWICPYPGGHIQATGLDDRGRKQYLYHPRWRERRDQAKFEDMVAFARTLPDLREHIEREMARDDMSRAHVLACAVRLLDRGFFRVGGEDYAVTNQSYGLATIRKEHVRLRGDTLLFDYPAKSGKRQIRAVVDPLVADTVARLKKRRGGGAGAARLQGAAPLGRRPLGGHQRVPQGHDRRGRLGQGLPDVGRHGARGRRAAVSGEVAATKTGRKRAISRAVKEVAYYLGNTPAVARASYIDPRVFDRYRDGETIAALSLVAEEDDAPAIQGPVEEAVLDLID